MQPRSVFHFILAFSLTCGAAHAGPLTGRVVDPSGREVPRARVIVTGEGVPLRSALTDARGRFSLTAPDTGRYQVRIAVEGFGLEPLTVDGTAAPHDLGDVALAISALSESLVVSAAQVEIPLSQAAAGVTIITGGELQQRQLHTVADALRTVPGLTVVSTGGYGAVTGVFPRGGESNYTLVLIDGVQANSFGGDFDFAHLSTTNVERIEIVRGPQSALFGSNAIGAVVRIVTRRGGPLTGSASIEGGSFGTSRLAAGGSGSHGAWEWGGSTERLQTDGANGRRTGAGLTVANDEYSRHSVAGSAGWRGAGGASVRSDVRFARDDRGFPGPYGTNPIGAYGGIDTVSRGDYDRWTAALTGALPIGKRVRTHAQAGYNRHNGDFRSAFGDSESFTRQISGRAQADVSLPGHLDVSAGVDVLAERAGSTYITGAGGQRIPVERRVAGVFGEARWNRAERLFVTAGLRVDDIRRDAIEASDDPFSPRPRLEAESIVSTNPKVAAAWLARPGNGTFTKLRAAAGTGIRPPDGFEIAFTDNPSLRPERSTSVEAGIEQALAAGRLLLDATAFVNEYDDLIVSVGSFAQSSRYRTDNISNARARGLELNATARGRLVVVRGPIDVEARVGYTLLDTEVLAVDQAQNAPPPFTAGEPLLRRPRHQFSADLSVSAGRLSAYIRGGGRGRALDVEPSYGTFGGLFHSPGYTTWNAGASWRVLRQVEAFGRVTNLLDRDYEEALGFPALGRGAIIGVRVAAGR